MAGKFTTVTCWLLMLFGAFAADLANTDSEAAFGAAADGSCGTAGEECVRDGHTGATSENIAQAGTVKQVETDSLLQARSKVNRRLKPKGIQEDCDALAEKYSDCPDADLGKTPECSPSEEEIAFDKANCGPGENEGSQDALLQEADGPKENPELLEDDVDLLTDGDEAMEAGWWRRRRRDRRRRYGRFCENLDWGYGLHCEISRCDACCQNYMNLDEGSKNRLRNGEVVELMDSDCQECYRQMNGSPWSCTCQSSWTSSEDGGTCGNTQYGCPSTSCDGGMPWCLVNQDCASDNWEGWSWCHSNMAAAEVSYCMKCYEPDAGCPDSYWAGRGHVALRSNISARLSAIQSHASAQKSASASSVDGSVVRKSNEC